MNEEDHVEREENRTRDGEGREEKTRWRSVVGVGREKNRGGGGGGGEEEGRRREEERGRWYRSLTTMRGLAPAQTHQYDAI